MENNEAMAFHKKYTRAINILRCALVLITVPLAVLTLIFDFSFVFFAAMIFIFIVLLQAGRLWYTVQLSKIISNELNPPKLKGVLDAKPSFYQIEWYLAFYANNGDYQETVNICNAKLNEKRCSRNSRLGCASILVSTYFLLGDTEAMCYALGQFDAELNKHPSNTSQKAYPLMRLYRLYANKEYEKIKELYGSDEKNGYNKATLMKHEYIHAINFYTLGETEKAKELFEKIIEEAPLLGIAKLSKKHIEAIEAGKEYETDTVKLAPDEAYEMPKGQKSIKIRKTVSSVCNVILVLAAAFLLLVQGITDKSNREYEQRLSAAISQSYGDGFEILDYFLLKRGDEDIEAVCIFEEADGTLELGYLVKYIDSGESVFETAMSDIEVGTIYYAYSSCTDYIIEFQLYENKKDVPKDNYHISKIKLDGDTYYLCISGIEKELSAF